MTSLRFPPWFVVLALGLGVTDGWSTIRALAQSDVRMSSAAFAFATTVGVVLLPFIVVAPLVSKALGARSIQIVADALGLRGAARPVAALVFTAAFGLAATQASIVGRRLVSGARAEVAAPSLVLVAFAIFALAGAGAWLVCTRLAPLAGHLAARPRLDAAVRALAIIGVPAVALETLHALLPGDSQSVLHPMAFAMVLALATSFARVDQRLAPWLLGRSGVAVWCALVAYGLAAFALVDHVPGRARLAVLYRTAYAAPLLAATRGLVDRDPGEPLVLALVEPPELVAAPVAALSPVPNIVVVHLDAVRPDHLAFGGGAGASVPELDRFRRSATWFSHAYTVAPSTRFAMASMFTGLDVERIPQKREPGRFTLLPEAVTVAERLDARGYDRIGITFPYVLQTMQGIGQGFRVWDTGWAPGVDERTEGHDGAKTTSAVFARLAEQPTDVARPFFVYAHYLCAHRPFPSEIDEGSETEAYDAALSACDADFGRLLRGLEARSDYDRTVVVVLSDHGEMLGEHGFSGHGVTLFEPAVRSLLMMRVPNGVASTVDAPVVLSDLAPTLVALAGAEPLPASRARNLLAAPAAAERAIYLYADDTVGGVHVGSRAVVEGRFKYVRDMATGIHQLFDIEADPGERRDVGRFEPRANLLLAQRLAGWMSFTSRPR